MNDADLIPLLLLMLFSVGLTVGLGMVLALVKRPQRLVHRASRGSDLLQVQPGFARPAYCPRPTSWLAVKGKSLQKVQTALQLHNPRPCPLAEGLTGDINLFIAPPVRGWILIVGAGLPDPSDDVDTCFKFLAALSRKLGEVQFFSANPVVQHHAWIRMSRGQVERAFSWAGRTNWNQGRLTAAERDAGVLCPDYGEVLEGLFEAGQGFPGCNVEKVPSIAAKWSLDPGALESRVLETRQGIAGEW